MKAILVIDMPSDCYGCPCENQGVCMVKLAHVESIDKPSWCPLKPMPIKKEALMGMGKINYGKALGWNDCIEEIENG